MFGAVFKALRRVFDNSVVPGFVAIGAVVLEWMLNLVTWGVVMIADLFLSALGWIMQIIPFPEITIEEGTFGAKFLDLAEIAGLWPALGLYIGALAVVFLTRIVTLGFIGK